MNQNTILWKRIKDNEQMKRSIQEQNKKLYVISLELSMNCLFSSV
jgi:hypothetical protein